MESSRDMPRSKSAENLFKEPPKNLLPPLPPGGSSTPMQRKQIVLPTEHAINTTGNFRRSRSQNRRTPATCAPTSANNSSKLIFCIHSRLIINLSQLIFSTVLVML